MSLDDILHIIQIVFYITVALITVLTYFNARKGILNTVNTEYQKRMMDGLKDLSEQLYDEFNPNSDRYWLNRNHVEVFEEINERFRENREEILRSGEFVPGYPTPPGYDYLKNLADRVRSDPFIPKQIRESIYSHLKKRYETRFNVYMDVMEEYSDSLAEGEYIDTLDKNKHWLHNQANDKLRNNNCGIEQIEEEVHRLRLEIQEYFESFNPKIKS